MTLGINTNDIAALAVRLRDARQKGLIQAGLRSTQVLIGEIRRSIIGWTSRTSTVKSGNLARSFKPSFVANSDKLIMGAFSDAIYARIHEFGGTITPKNGQWLTIPITNVARRTGARGMNLFFLQSGGRAPILASPISGGGNTPGAFKPQFILRKSVYITPKRYLENAQAMAKPKITELFVQALKQIVKKGA